MARNIYMAPLPPRKPDTPYRIKKGWRKVHPNSMAAKKWGRTTFAFNGDSGSSAVRY